MSDGPKGPESAVLPARIELAHTVEETDVIASQEPERVRVFPTAETTHSSTVDGSQSVHCFRSTMTAAGEPSWTWPVSIASRGREDSGS